MKRRTALTAAVVLGGALGLATAPGFSQTAPGGATPGAPSTKDRAPTSPGAPGAAGESQAPGATGTKKGADTMSSAQIKELQQALQKKGHNPGASGVMDDKTREAIRAFQKEEGLAVTGNVDEKTAKALGVSISADRPGAGTTPGGSGAGGLGGSGKGSSERPASPGSPGGSSVK